MIPAYIYWLALVILFGIAEAATLGLTSIWFALGALGAMVVAIFDGALLLQIAVFVVISGVTVWLTRGWGQKRFNESREPTNADRILGQHCQVLEDIDNDRATGVVKADGKIWTARSVTGAVIPAGSTATIRSIEGVKVYVTPAN
ncbi:MAG: NfeD family protein [Clostridia bacterium]|nr:NfeD family protein [Clostridia bacterium]